MNTKNSVTNFSFRQSGHSRFDLLIRHTLILALFIFFVPIFSPHRFSRKKLVKASEKNKRNQLFPAIIIAFFFSFTYRTKKERK